MAEGQCVFNPQKSRDGLTCYSISSNDEQAEKDAPIAKTKRYERALIGLSPRLDARIDGTTCLCKRRAEQSRRSSTVAWKAWRMLGKNQPKESSRLRKVAAGTAQIADSQHGATNDSSRDAPINDHMWLLIGLFDDIWSRLHTPSL